jgi:hypothetical protein
MKIYGQQIQNSMLHAFTSDTENVAYSEGMEDIFILKMKAVCFS